MNLQEITAFLARVALGDNRQVGAAHIQDWEDLLPGDLTFQEATEAYRHHRRTSTEYLQPAHIIGYVRKTREARRREIAASHTAPDYPAGLSWVQEKVWRETWWAQIHAGADTATATAQADARVGARRPGLVPKPVAALIATARPAPGSRPAAPLGNEKPLPQTITPDRKDHG